MPEGNNEQLYTRQQSLHLEVPPKLTVIGCGGIGSWVAIFAAMTGIKSLVLFDPDILEETNRNRLPFCQGSVNRPKVDVVADFVKAIRPDAMVYTIQDRLTKDSLEVMLKSHEYKYIDCTDSPKTQIMTYNLCKAYGATYIRAGYDGTRIMATSTVSGWIKKDADEEPYEVFPSWVVPAATIAALAVGKLCKFFDQEIGLDISEIGIPALQKQQKKVTARCFQRAKDTEKAVDGSDAGAEPEEVTIEGG